MKQVAGNMNLDKVCPEAAGPEGKGIEPYQGLLHAIWTDERFASCCVSMRNTDQVRENAEAARVFTPLSKAELERNAQRLCRRRPHAVHRMRRPMQPGCRHQCRTRQPHTLSHLSRSSWLSREARRLYSELSDAERNWAGADLEAAREACPSKLDFARLLPRAQQVLG